MLNAVPDHRKRHTYEVGEILSAGLLMFVLRRGSRNHTDALGGKTFETNYLKIFGMRLPIMDTVHLFLKQLPAEELEKLRETLVGKLMERKVFEKWKFQGYYNLSFDGTGVYVFDHEPFEGCPYKETKNGIQWYVSVLESKLVFVNGFSISLDSEWMVNQNGKFNKQDCESVAFKRLVARIKATYPRLSVLVSADGLYCNGPVFNLIKEVGWKFVFTFKDDSLKTVWRQLKDIDRQTIEKVKKKNQQGQWIYERHSFTNGLDYKRHKINFVEHLLCANDGEIMERHVHLTNLKVNNGNVAQISLEGRMRWKIENEGFNCQKNHGYGLGHKYARKDLNTIKNYYLLMQIGHMISQLVERLNSFKSALNQSGKTFKAAVEEVVSAVKENTLALMETFRSFINTKQLRY